MAGFAGIFGFSARFAGGGSEALFSFRSAGLLRPFAACARGDSRPGVSPTADPDWGVTGRAWGEGETPADTVSRGK
jgi:hypothetical protein